MLNIAQMKGHASSKNTDVGPIAWVRNEKALEWLIHAIEQSSEVVFDLETTGLDEHAVSGGASNNGVAARVSVASFTLPQRDAGGQFWDGSEPTSYVLPLSHPSSTWQGKWRRTLREVMAAAVRADRPIIGHNVKFDARWIYATTGVDISERLTWDTMVSAHLLDENESTKLKERAPRTFGVERWDDHDLSYAGASEDVPLEELGEYACIAEGQMVLTHLGEVPIEKVTTAHLLWDGVEWVSHEGVICKGTQPVLQLDNGLKGTSDHLVLTEEGDYACLGSIQTGARRAATPESASARGGLSDPDRAYVARASASDCRGNVREVREDLGKAYERSSTREERLPLPVGREVGSRSSRESTSRSLSCNSAAMYPWHGDLAPSRRPGDRVPVLLVSGVHSVGSGESPTSQLPWGNFGSDRRGRALRAGESSARGLRGAGPKYATSRVCGVHGAGGCPRPSLAPSEGRQSRLPAREGRVGSETPAGDVGGGSNLEAGENYVKVYDILNAGPRSRFTVSGVVVSNCRDTYWTWRLYVAHREQMFLRSQENEEIEPPLMADEIQDARLGTLAEWVAMPTTRALTKMEQRGIKLDLDWTRQKLTEDRGIATELMTRIVDEYGGDVPGEPSLAPTSKWFQAFTEEAVRAGNLEVMSMTRRGKPQWSKSVLKKNARHGSTLAQLILDQRAASKRSEFLASWLEQASPDGRIHANYRAGHVVTGRLSSANPNMQQVTYALRPAFVPSEGYVLVDLDYSQIELRVAAFISRCEPMLEAFRAGADLHRRLGAQIAGVSEGEVTKEQRQAAKAANFGLLYGMGAEGFQSYSADAYGVEITLDEAQHTREQFFELWDGLREWHLKTIAKAHRDGFVVSPLGRVRRVPGVWDSSDWMQQEAERQAVNSPVQGMASDLLQMGAASIAGVLPGSDPVAGVHLVGTVHDSIVCEVREDSWQELVAQAQERLTNLSRPLRRLGVELDVPIVADYAAGTRWGQSDIGEG